MKRFRHRSKHIFKQCKFCNECHNENQRYQVYCFAGGYTLFIECMPIGSVMADEFELLSFNQSQVKSSELISPPFITDQWIVNTRDEK